MDPIVEKYSILQTLTLLEEQFIKGNCNDNDLKNDYIKLSNELLNQWNIINNNNNNDNNNDLNDLTFLDNLKHYKLLHVTNVELREVLKLGIRRIQIGINGFDEQLKEKEKAKPEPEPEKEETSIEVPTETIKSGKEVAQATSAFITLLDAIKLNYNSPEILHPLLSKIITTSSNINDNFKGRSNLINWLIKLNQLKNNDDKPILDDNQLENLLLDVDTAYNGFFDSL